MTASVGQNRKWHFGQQFGAFTESVFKNLISALLKYQKDILLFYVSYYHLSFIQICFWHLPVLYVKFSVKPPDFGIKMKFFNFSLFWQPFSVTIATVRVQSI